MSNVNAVRGAVKLNGQVISGWTAFEVDNNAFASADSFSVTFAANALPPDRDAKWLSEQKSATVELFAGVPADPSHWTSNELPLWIVGTVDNIEADLVAGTIHVSGRDFTQRLIDEKSTVKYQNKTASQIASILAAKHDLTPVVTPTKTLAGKFYEIDHEHMQDARTDWDLLCRLARAEQFVVYVKGNELHFEPRPDPSSVTPFRVVWTPPDAETGYSSSNIESLHFERALTVSKGVIVIVRSWNDAAQKVFTATYPPSKQTTIAPGNAKIGSGAQTYYYSVANLTQEKVLQMARAKHAEIIQHEMKCEFSLPAAGNDDLDVTSLIALTGTGTAFDQTYFPDSLRRELSVESGYTLHVSAKNHAPDSQEEKQ